MAVHPSQASPTVAETAFAFLTSLGFTRSERWVIGGASFRDGWRLTSSCPKTQVVVQYMDLQFEVRFVRDTLAVSYLELDRDLFDRRSRFHGDMFPPQKVDMAIRRTADDIQEDYGRTLSGDESEWNRIARLKAVPPRRPHLP